MSTRSLVITATAATYGAINTALEDAGYGPGNLSVPMRNGVIVQRDEAGNLLQTPTHYSSHWWVTGPEFAALSALRDTVLDGVTFNSDPDPSNPAGIFSATNGDYVRIQHKEFSPGQWGWRAEFAAQAGEFEPGVRAIAIYSDAAHQNYLYTTGAFTLANGVYATEWNESKPAPAGVHWSMIFASQPEHSSTLAADAAEDIGWLRIGVPGSAVPPPGQAYPDWVQPTGAHDAYAVGDRVIHDRPQSGGALWVFESAINANTTEPGRDGTFDRWWTPVEAA